MRSFNFLLNTVIIVTSFVWGKNCVFLISIVMGKCATLILQKLRFGVCHCCSCILIYNDYIILLKTDQWCNGEVVDGEMV